MGGVSREQFFASRLHQDAVVKRLEVIGEIVKKLDHDFRASHPELPWKGMVGLRDVLVHDYDKIILEQLWELVYNGDLLEVKNQITHVLQTISPPTPPPLPTSSSHSPEI